MIQKIVDNGLTNENQQREIMRALAGTWGNTETDTGNVVDLGRARIGAVFSGTTIANTSSMSALAIAIFSDGTSQIIKLSGNESKDVYKQISMALIIGLLT